MHKKQANVVVSVLFLISLLLSGCQQQGYQYNNLVSENGINEFESTLANMGASAEDISALSSYIQVYRNTTYATDVLVDGWHTATLTRELYDVPTVINMYDATPFEDINCRRAAYLLYHEFFTVDGTVALTDMATELDSIHLNSDNDQQKYEVLFGPIISDKPLPEAVAERWRDVGANFSGPIQLVSLWGSQAGQIEHLHCGILHQTDERLFFFEKTGTLLPYQTSIFSSGDMLLTYLLNFTDDYENMTVFVNDTVLQSAS